MAKGRNRKARNGMAGGTLLAFVPGIVARTYPGIHTVGTVLPASVWMTENRPVRHGCKTDKPVL